MEKNSKQHEVDIVFNVSRFKFYMSIFSSIVIFLSGLFIFLMRINIMANDVEILKAKTEALYNWSISHDDSNRLFREDIIRRLDRFEYNQRRVYEKLGFQWYETEK